MIIAQSTDRKSKLNRPTSDNFILIPSISLLVHSCRSCTDNVACRMGKSREIDNDALKIDFLSFRSCGRKIFRHQAVCQSMGLSRKFVAMWLTVRSASGSLYHQSQKDLVPQFYGSKMYFMDEQIGFMSAKFYDGGCWRS